ncbi:MAG: hypothetical protein ACK5MT_20050 [Actinomycetales bacterium]
MSKQQSSQLTGGIDVGNGYVKGVVRGTAGGQDVLDSIDPPSAVVSTSRATPKVPEADSDAVKIVVEDDFFNHVAASFTLRWSGTPICASSAAAC